MNKLKFLQKWSYAVTTTVVLSIIVIATVAISAIVVGCGKSSDGQKQQNQTSTTLQSSLQAGKEVTAVIQKLEYAAGEGNYWFFFSVSGNPLTEYEIAECKDGDFCNTYRQVQCTEQSCKVLGSTTGKAQAFLLGLNREGKTDGFYHFRIYDVEQPTAAIKYFKIRTKLNNGNWIRGPMINNQDIFG